MSVNGRVLMDNTRFKPPVPQQLREGEGAGERKRMNVHRKKLLSVSLQQPIGFEDQCDLTSGRFLRAQRNVNSV